jgi:hypothetical protein
VSGQDLALGDLQFRQVSTHDLRDRGIHCDQVWDVDQIISTADWVRYSMVQEETESYFFLKEITEVHDRVQLLAMRIYRLLQCQCNVIFRILNL